MTTEEPRYTLPEAARLLAREECMVEGHDLDQTLIQAASGRTLIMAVRCTRCGGTFTETGGPWVETTETESTHP